MTVEFDQEFWEETVCEWAATQSTYRTEETLPPATPEHGWECQLPTAEAVGLSVDSRVSRSQSESPTPPAF